MKHILIIISFLLLAFPIAVYSAQNRVALVIGNGAYKEGPLRNPVNDARTLKNVLTRAGFNVTLLENGNKRQMLEAVKDFGRKLRKSDAALFYFAGHGVQYMDRNWIFPIGTDIGREQDVEFETVNVQRILGEMEGGTKKRVNILIIDACRKTPTFRGYRSASRGLSVPRVQPEGSIIAFSTAPGTISYDGDGRNSPYVTELSKHMLTPGLKIEDVFKRTRIGVKNRTARKPSPQIPWENSSLMGDFYFMFGDQAQTSTESVASYNEPAGSQYEGQLSEERPTEVVVDPINGWTWQDAPDGVKRTYREAVEYCKNLSIGNFSNWKLPSVLRLKQVFKQRNIFSWYAIDSWYWSTHILIHEEVVDDIDPFGNRIKKKESSSIIVPKMVNFKNLQVRPKSFSDLSDSGRRWRKELDAKWGFLSNPHSHWRYRRKQVRLKLKSIRPNYTKNQLELVYESLGLSTESNPNNRHYVRCMHD